MYSLSGFIIAGNKQKKAHSQVRLPASPSLEALPDPSHQ
jgi:hypothetical protein